MMAVCLPQPNSALIQYQTSVPDPRRIFPWLLLLIALAGCRTAPVKDADGNKYRTVKIGAQVWMAENLRTTRYRDGSDIPNVTKYGDWEKLDTPAYCWYANDPANREDYGALYNWYAVETGLLCPEGWHIPSDAEWKALRAHLGEDGYAGDALKKTGTAHWKPPNEGASNATGFGAPAGGYRSFDGTFNLLRYYAYWWSATESEWYRGTTDDPITRAFFWSLRYDGHDLYRYAIEKGDGFSVRCIKDSE
jgi:uncharacterized protein (TIGR02145 family)